MAKKCCLLCDLSQLNSDPLGYSANPSKKRQNQFHNLTTKLRTLELDHFEDRKINEDPKKTMEVS